MARCAHCGGEYNQIGRGRPRRWCYSCLPAYTGPDIEYRRTASRLNLFARTGQHGACCGIPRTIGEPVLFYTVRPICCLYCDQPLTRIDSFTCSEHSTHHRRIVARRWRQSPEGRARVNAAKTSRRFTTKNRWKIIALLLERDGNHCGLCGFPTPVLGDDPATLDHVVPLSQGGSDDLSNLQLAHRSCNLHAADKRLVS